MVLIALAWIPVIQGARGLYEYLQAVQGYLAPPIFVVFFFGVFFKRLNAKGCFAAMVVGFLLGIFRMLVDTPVTMKMSGILRTGYKPGSFLWIVNHINFQYFSVLITLVSAAVMVAVSYMTQAPDYVRIQSLTSARRQTKTAADPLELGLARGAGFGSCDGCHHRGLHLLHGIGRGPRSRPSPHRFSPNLPIRLIILVGSA